VGIIMKIVINKCYGGFGLSHKAVMRLAELMGIEIYPYYTDYDRKDGRYVPWDEQGKEPFGLHYSTKPVEKDADLNNNYFSVYDLKRNDPLLVQVVEELGDEANGSCAELKVVEVPGYVSWTIEEYDGIEWVAEKHQTWS
jgi:hypothetical protein